MSARLDTDSIGWRKLRCWTVKSISCTMEFWWLRFPAKPGLELANDLFAEVVHPYQFVKEPSLRRRCGGSEYSKMAALR